MKQVERAIAVVKELNLDAVLVSNGYNMRYISGFSGATGYLLITAAGRKLLFTDSRYTIAAGIGAPDFTVVEIGKGGYVEALNKALEEDNIQTLGFEAADLLYSTYASFKEKLVVKEFVPIHDELSNLRMIKSEEEIACLRQAEHIVDLAFAQILNDLKPGMTELEVAAKLEYYLKMNGAEKTSFETIIASGVHSSMPHAEPDEKKLEMGDFITMDFGCVYHGYCSDMTRTVVLGKANDKQKEIYNTVLKAQLAVLDMAKPGLAGKEYDKVARDIIAEAGYGACFGHGLGHGVGLFIHENPRLSSAEERIMQPNMVVTVEPGIYVKDFGGVRIEDMIVFTEDGHENFAKSEKKLIEL